MDTHSHLPDNTAQTNKIQEGGGAYDIEEEKLEEYNEEEELGDSKKNEKPGNVKKTKTWADKTEEIMKKSRLGAYSIQ